MKISKLITLIVVSVFIAILLASALNVYIRGADSALADNTPAVGAFEKTPFQNTPRTAPGKNYLPIIFLNAPVAINCINTINGIAGGGCASTLTLQLTAGGVITGASGYGLRVNNPGGNGVAGIYAKVGAGSGAAINNTTVGIWADSFTSTAMLATSDSGSAIAGISNSATGVTGVSYSTGAPGVSATAFNGGPGVYANGVIGMDGVGASLGVRGTGDITGVLGISTLNNPSYGVNGQQGGGSGIFFLSSAGVWGDSKSAYGVLGTSISGTAIYGASQNGTAIYGSSQNGNAMYLQRSVNGTGFNPADNVAVIENTNTNNSADVLALKIGSTVTPTQANNFITFIGGSNNSVGAIQGNNAGSVELAGAGNDYAEYLPRADANEALSPGDIVGIINGHISKATRGATQVMVISTGPIVAGNDPGEAERGGYALVAFIGQARVRVRGVVRAGDFIIPSGAEDGTGIAVSPETITPKQFAQVAGQAWQVSNDAAVKFVNVAVGLIRSDPTVARLIAHNQDLDARLTALEEANDLPSPNVFNFNNLPLWGIVGLLALLLVKRPK